MCCRQSITIESPENESICLWMWVSWQATELGSPRLTFDAAVNVSRMNAPQTWLLNKSCSSTLPDNRLPQSFRHILKVPKNSEKQITHTVSTQWKSSNQIQTVPQCNSKCDQCKCKHMKNIDIFTFSIYLFITTKNFCVEKNLCAIFIFLKRTQSR